jgi:hypothetical protein
MRSCGCVRGVIAGDASVRHVRWLSGEILSDEQVIRIE